MLPPCVLCWYQRIPMYPLVFLLGLGIVRRDAQVRIYGLGLSLMGLLVATSHVLLYYGIIPESISPCTQGISCTTRQIEWAGFVTIPLLSWAAFLLISLLLWVGRLLPEEIANESSERKEGKRSQ